MVEKILNNTTPYRKIRASHELTTHRARGGHVKLPLTQDIKIP